MFRIPKTLPLRTLRSTTSTGNLQLRALTSPAAAALKEYHHAQPPPSSSSSRQQDNHHHHQYSHLQNRSVHVSTLHREQLLLQTLSSSSYSSSSSLPQPPHLPPSLRPKTSSNVFISSLQRGGIDLTPLGTKSLSQILSPIPFTSITPTWLTNLDSAIQSSHLNSPLQNHTNPSTGKRLQPTYSKKPWEEWVKYQVDKLVERFVRMEGWEEVWDGFEYLLMDEGLVVRGDEEVRRILEVLVRNGWVVSVEEDGIGEDGGYGYEVVSPGRVGRFEGEKFAF
ncbi:hypothetical protein TWF281_007054 [Arthrobotrys megalospora]